MKYRYFKRLLFLNLLTSSHCTLSQIALMLALSYIFSSSVFIFTFFTGLYLMAMGCGVLLIERFHFDDKKIILLIILNSLIGICLASPGITGIMLINESIRHLFREAAIDLTWIVLPCGIVLTILIGIVSGAELPLFSKLSEKQKWHLSQPVIGVLTSDYLGAFLGIIIFTFLLNPFLGLIRAIICSQIVTLIGINGVYFSLSFRQKRMRYVFFVLMLVNVFIVCSILWNQKFMNFLDH